MDEIEEARGAPALVPVSWPPAPVRPGPLLGVGIMPLVGWILLLVTLYFMFAFVIPSLLTIAVLAAGLAVIRLGRHADRDSLALSAVLALAVAAIAVIYRAGPTSGFQVANGLLVALALATSAMSVVGLARTSRSRP